MSTIGSRRSLVALWLGLATLIVVAQACGRIGYDPSSQSGILVETSTAPGFTESIDTLRFYIGEDIIDEPLHFADRGRLSDVTVSGRDLAANPYQLLVRPTGSSQTPSVDSVATVDSALGDSVVIAVLAFNASGAIIGADFISAPIPFEAGNPREVVLEIGGIGPDLLVAANDCLQWRVDMGFLRIGRGNDLDCDGYTGTGGDCDDLDPTRNPARAEDCGNGIDDNCNALVDSDDTVDQDGDGFVACPVGGMGADCNDADGDVNPNALDLCNGIDDNCNAICDEGSDADGDSVTICGSVVASGVCVGVGEPDCNDDDGSQFPGKLEIADGLDNNCSGVCDDDPILDADGDGFTLAGRFGLCGLNPEWADCGPDDASIHPGAQELCDGIDSDCDGGETATTPCFNSAGACIQGIRNCVEGSPDSACVVGGGNPLPAELCQVYTSCDGNAQSVDPYSCVADELSQTADLTEACATTSLSGAGCPAARVSVLPPGGPYVGVCSFELIGPLQQQGLDLLLVASDDSSGRIVSDCDTRLEVQASQRSASATVSIIFTSPVGDVQILNVDINNTIVASCGAQPLTCSSWPSVP